MSKNDGSLARKKASQSTGPKSKTGKGVASRNAITHGILSAGLLVGGEDPAEYDALFQSLVADLRPVGALEMIHVERIATAVWRQRRLVRAESAAIEFHREANDTRKMLTDTLGLSESSRIKDQALIPLTEKEELTVGIYSAILSELDELAELDEFPESLDDLSKRANLFVQYVEVEADAAECAPIEYIFKKSGVSADHFVRAVKVIIKLLRPDIEKVSTLYQQRLMVSMLKQRQHVMKVVPPEAELFARYQTSLDNMLTKAVRALNEAQDRRIALIDQAS